jgi:ADP-heptose:LPS heptosyltransferase
MELPSLRALRAAAPRARISAVGAWPAVQLLEGQGVVDHVMTYQRLGLRHWGGDPLRPGRLERWARALRSADYVVDALHAPRSISTAVDAMVPVRLENDQDVQRAWVQRGAGLARAVGEACRAGWGLPTWPAATPRYVPTASASRSGDAWLRAAGGLCGRGRVSPVAASTDASTPLKRWPAERLAAVLDAVVDGGPDDDLGDVPGAVTGSAPGAGVLFTGPDPAGGRQVVEHMRRASAVRLVVARPLQEVAATLGKCRLMIGNDSGLTHLAAAVGTPVVGVYGPTSPRVYLPPGDQHSGLGGRDIGCGYRDPASLMPPQCWLDRRCLIGERSCIDRVGVDEVVQAARCSSITINGQSPAP